jgi:hypothetical protein
VPLIAPARDGCRQRGPLRLHVGVKCIAIVDQAFAPGVALASVVKVMTLRSDCVAHGCALLLFVGPLTTKGPATRR